MTVDAAPGKRIAYGLTSTLAWLLLLVAFLATVLTSTGDKMSHVGNAASAIVQHLSKNPTTIDSLLNEFKKNADPKTASEIEANRATINAAISSLGADKAFQDSLANTLNKISKAFLDGSKTVTVDFRVLATAVADKVNAAAKAPVISKNDLAKFKPQVLELSKDSTNFSEVRSRIREVTLAWLLWFVLLGVLYLFRSWNFLRTAGWQLFSVGAIFLGAHFAASVVALDVFNNSTMSEFQKDLVPEVLKSLTEPMLALSIIVLLAGLILLVSDQLVRNRLRSRAI